MGKQIYFGNERHAQWVPAPASGMQRTRNNFSEEMSFRNGGLWVDNSAGAHLTFPMEFPVQDASVYEGIEAFARFAAGEYGDDYLRFVDTMHGDENLFSEVWASPGVVELGAKSMFGTVPTFSDTSANSYNKPYRKATYSVDTSANAVPTAQNSVFTFIIPPTHTLSIGGSGSVTGTAVLRVQPVNINGTLAATANITLTADATAPAFSNTFSGTTYKAVRVYITRTTSATSTITLTSLWAQILLTSVTATITRHIPGKGHSGLKFRGGAQAENYFMAEGHQIGASFELAEVQPWE